MKKRITVLIILISVVICSIAAIYFFNINKKYKVEFHTYSKDNYESIYLKKNESNVISNYNPKKEGYYFNGWLLNGQIFIPGSTIYEDISLNSLWAEDGYDYVNVVFSAGEGYDDILVLVEKKQKVTTPHELIKDNDDFLGWYVNDQEYDFNNRIQDNLIIYGKWKNKERSNSISIKAMERKVCEEGYSLENDQCIKPDILSNSKEPTIIYSCNEGYKLDNAKCSKEKTTSTIKKYYCNDGYLSNSVCIHKVRKSLGGYANDCSSSDSVRYGHYEALKNKCNQNGGTMEVEFRVDGSLGCRFICYKYVEEYLSDPIIKYECPSGYKMNNGKCYGTEIIPANISEYKCDSDTYLFDKKCYSNVIKNEPTIQFYCYENFELKNDRCEIILDKYGQ